MVNTYTIAGNSLYTPYNNVQQRTTYRTTNENRNRTEANNCNPKYKQGRGFKKKHEITWEGSFVLFIKMFCKEQKRTKDV